MDEGWVSPEVTVVFHQKEENQSEIVNSVPYFIPLDDRFNCFQTELTRRKRYEMKPSSFPLPLRVTVVSVP